MDGRSAAQIQGAVVGLGERWGGEDGPGMHSMHRSRHWTRHQARGDQISTRLSTQDHEIERYCTACRGRPRIAITLEKIHDVVLWVM